MTTRTYTACPNASSRSTGCLLIALIVFVCLYEAASAAVVRPCNLQRLQSDCGLSAPTGAVAFSGALPSIRSVGPPAISGTTADLSGKLCILELSFVGSQLHLMLSLSTACCCHCNRRRYKRAAVICDTRRLSPARSQLWTWSAAIRTAEHSSKRWPSQRQSAGRPHIGGLTNLAAACCFLQQATRRHDIHSE
jgi:hypothetical protein